MAKRQKQVDEEQQQKLTMQFLQYRSLHSVHTYGVHFFPIDEDRILFFACPQERTEREEADRKKAEAAKRQKQVDEEQQQKVTIQSSAVILPGFCAYVSCSFLSN